MRIAVVHCVVGSIRPKRTEATSGRPADHAGAFGAQSQIVRLSPSAPTADFCGTERPELYRFLDAGIDETVRALSEPASKKRRGTKSREVGHPAAQRALWGLVLAPRSRLGRGELHALHARAGERARKASRPALEGYQRAPGASIAMNRVERDRRQRGASAKGRDSGGARPEKCGPQGSLPPLSAGVSPIGETRTSQSAAPRQFRA